MKRVKREKIKKQNKTPPLKKKTPSSQTNPNMELEI
jgi:hypothetical protein